MTEKPQLREKQIEQLAFYISHPKCLDLSDPGTGKTPPVCVYAYFVWNRWENKTLWTMPKSILRKNHDEMLRFTEFAENDVVILRTDRANLTDKWDGPTIESFRTKRGWKVRLAGQETTTLQLREMANEPLNFFYRDAEGKEVKLGRHSKHAKLLEVQPVFDPEGLPEKVEVKEPEVFKDLIEANKGAKVFLTTFAFAAEHYERLLAANPSIDLLLVDELHMPGGYSTPASGRDQKPTKSVASFYHINRHVSRFVGMTGTLINGRLDSAFPAIHVIEPRYYGSYHGFMFEHAAIMDDFGRVDVWKNENKLKAILAKHSIKRTFEEVYGKEPVVFFTEFADVSDEVRPHYDKFHSEALLELDDGRILDGSLPGVALIRARQILAHPETMFKDIPEWTGKDERIALHLAEGKKTIIYAALKPEQERIVRLAQSLGLRTALINSDVSGPQRERIDAAAQRGEIDVIVASGPTAAVGFNWEMFDLVIFASIDFMDTNILQAYRRASRGTRTSVLRVIFLRYRNSIDTRQYQIVRDKSKLANRIDETRPILSFSEEE
jgi:hypothetical protein